jgi:hypothetical protein
VLKLAFWALVALDLLGIGLFFLLGLAAAGSSRTNPLLVILLLLVIPAAVLGTATLLFTRATTMPIRLVALLIAAAPLLIAASSRGLAEFEFRSSTNAAGQMTFFRSGPMRDIAEAILRNDASAVAALAPTVDLNRSGVSDMTLLGLAIRQLRSTPDQHEVLRTLLAAGADPNRAAQYELPLAVAIQVSGKAGIRPAQLLLDAGANPNLTSSYGEPVFYAATGVSAAPEVLSLLIDRGADVNAENSQGRTALISAANTRNWKAALLLLRRGADPERGHGADGQTFRSLVDRDSGQPDHDGARADVSRYLQQH